MRFIVISVEDLSSSYRKAIECLRDVKYDSLFLDLPTTAETSIQVISYGQPWGEEISALREAGLLSDPEDTQLLRATEPLFAYLQGTSTRVWCYRDAFRYDLLRRLAGDTFALTASSKIFGIKASRWLSLLEEVVLIENESLEMDGDYIIHKAGEENVVFGWEDLASYLSDKGYPVEMVTIDQSDKPLDMLKRVVAECLRKGEEVPSEVVEELVRAHLNFVELIIQSKSYEEAYGLWKNQKRHNLLR